MYANRARGGPPVGAGHGLHFLNDEWNGSITNGKPITLEWNEDIDVANAKLGVFRVTYPKDGVREFEQVTNLTECLEARSCDWTPKELEDNLYALCLTTISDGERSWAISPPWKPQEDKKYHLSAAAPILVPVFAILSLYALCLTICFYYRRKKRGDKQRQNPASGYNLQADDAVIAEDAAGRHPSVSSVDTTQTLTEPADYKKPASPLALGSEQRGFPSIFAAEQRGIWVESIHFDGVRYDRSRGGDDDDVAPCDCRNDHELSVDLPRRPQDMYVAPGTAI